MKTRLLVGLMLTVAFLSFSLGVAHAQQGQVQLLLSRNWGFSLGSQIQGQFTLAASGPSDIVSVTYQMDGKEMATVKEPPFSLGFNTDSYPAGNHTFGATVHTAGGLVLKSNAIDAEIVPFSGSWENRMRIIGPIVGLGLLVVAVAIGIQFLAGGTRRRFEPGELRSYGVRGGAVCPKCGRPFALSFLNLHVLTKELASCPYCGNWSLVSRASPAALEAARVAELQSATPNVPELSAEERLRQQIESSRYQ